MKRTVLALFAIAGLTVGCQTSHTQKDAQTKTAVVLMAHHFAPPMFVAGDRGVLWTVASRPQSGLALQTAYVRLSSDGRATVQVASYQYSGSDWAEVGPLLDRGRSREEAAAIKQEIEHTTTSQ